MRILLVGATGTAGTSVHATLAGRGHEIVSVGRTSGDLRCDISRPQEHDALWAAAGHVDAVVCAAGEVPYGRIDQLTPEDYLAAFTSKVLGQIALVRSGLDHVAERGSFTLISGITVREPIVHGAASAMANGALEAFVRSAAMEIAPRRINVVSPTVFTEDLDRYGEFFPGFPPVDLADVARAYVRSVEGGMTGQTFPLP